MHRRNIYQNALFGDLHEYKNSKKNVNYYIPQVAILLLTCSTSQHSALEAPEALTNKLNVALGSRKFAHPMSRTQILFVCLQ